MTDKQPNQAMPDDKGAAKPDGVNSTPSGGQSSGEAYPNAQSGKDGGHFDGGQTLKDYHGGAGGADNQATGTD